ncbi:hypothetical protein [Aliivibrio fischeri]|uniref:hypothetical protein n=1 Tax=Aliivibrio fischeri TaxID=668 RepID=UPI00080E9DF9|nr:hypothetical protein [Aliivibrio fischeri]OCH42026.1 hypothetical protein A6D99_18930 [Aliivibrio fischeri]
MKDIRFLKEQERQLATLLTDAGYSSDNRKMCIRYFKVRGDSTFVHHSLNIIRASKNTNGSLIVKSLLGTANGKASESQEDSYDTWFLNGYRGKAGSKLD